MRDEKPKISSAVILKREGKLLPQWDSPLWSSVTLFWTVRISESASNAMKSNLSGQINSSKSSSRMGICSSLRSRVSVHLLPAAEIISNNCNYLKATGGF